MLSGAYLHRLDSSGDGRQPFLYRDVLYFRGGPQHHVHLVRRAFGDRTGSDTRSSIGYWIAHGKKKRIAPQPLYLAASQGELDIERI